MSVQRFFGATVDFGSAYGASKAMSAITNATEAVATLEASHGIAQGEYGHVLTSGWDSLVGQPFRAKTVATNDVTLEGVNTSSTTFFPASQGAGTVREVSTFTPITQIYQEGGVALAGGEQAVEEYGFLSSARGSRRQVPNGFSPLTATIKVYYDKSAAWVALAEARALLEEDSVLRINLRSGAKILVAGLLRLTPPVADGNFLARNVVVYSSLEQMIDYAT